MRPPDPLDVDVHHRAPSGVGWPAPPVPQAADLAAAHHLIRAAVAPTPLVLSAPLSERWGREVWLKLEMLSPIRSFKHRGALVAVDHVAATSGASTIVTASTGNHGQGIAYAGRRAGLAVRVHAPMNTATEKLEAMRRLGAEVELAGTTLDEAQRAAQALVGPEVVYVEDGESAELMAGVASVVTEMLGDEPDLDTIVVPVGGGNLIAGSLLAARALDNPVTIVGAQSRSADGATRSWLAGHVVESPCSTFAGGLATTRPGALALSVMVDLLESVAIVGDEDLRAAMALAMATHGVLLEGAAAAPIAALELFGDRLPGRRIGLVLTGNWASTDELRQAVALLGARGPTT